MTEGTYHYSGNAFRIDFTPGMAERVVREVEERLRMPLWRRRPFDWALDCLADLAPRHFPPLGGRGRGYPLGSREMTRAEFARYLVENPGVARSLRAP